MTNDRKIKCLCIVGCSANGECPVHGNAVVAGPSTTWRVGKKVPYNVYGEDDRPICQCHTALDAKRIVEAVNDSAADDRDWQQIAEALEIPALSATREQIVEACRALKRRSRYAVEEVLNIVETALKAARP